MEVKFWKNFWLFQVLILMLVAGSLAQIDGEMNICFCAL
jgi:hypothetical protein